MALSALALAPPALDAGPCDINSCFLPSCHISRTPSRLATKTTLAAHLVAWHNRLIAIFSGRFIIPPQPKKKTKELAQSSVYVSVTRAPRRGKNVLFFSHFSFTHYLSPRREKETERIALRPGEDQVCNCWEGYMLGGNGMEWN